MRDFSFQLTQRLRFLTPNIFDLALSNVCNNSIRLFLKKSRTFLALPKCSINYSFWDIREKLKNWLSEIRLVRFCSSLVWSCFVGCYHYGVLLFCVSKQQQPKKKKIKNTTRLCTLYKDPNICVHLKQSI